MRTLGGGLAGAARGRGHERGGAGELHSDAGGTPVAPGRRDAPDRAEFLGVASISILSNPDLSRNLNRQRKRQVFEQVGITPWKIGSGFLGRCPCSDVFGLVSLGELFSP